MGKACPKKKVFIQKISQKTNGKTRSGREKVTVLHSVWANFRTANPIEVHPKCDCRLMKTCTNTLVLTVWNIHHYRGRKCLICINQK